MNATLATKLIFYCQSCFSKYKAEKPFLCYSDPLRKRKISLCAIRGNKS